MLGALMHPLAGDQAAVPPEHGAGGDQAAHRQIRWQEPDQRGAGCPAGPAQPGPGRAAQHSGLVPHYQQFRVLGRG
jgi:hypothetical protein